MNIEESETAVWLPGEVARVKNAPSRFISAKVGKAASFAGIGDGVGARARRSSRAPPRGSCGKSRSRVGGIGANATAIREPRRAGAARRALRRGATARPQRRRLHPERACTDRGRAARARRCAGARGSPIAAHAPIAIASAAPAAARPERAAGPRRRAARAPRPRASPRPRPPRRGSRSSRRRARSGCPPWPPAPRAIGSQRSHLRRENHVPTTCAAGTEAAQRNMNTTKIAVSKRPLKATADCRSKSLPSIAYWNGAHAAVNTAALAHHGDRDHAHPRPNRQRRERAEAERAGDLEGVVRRAQAEPARRPRHPDRDADRPGQRQEREAGEGPERGRRAGGLSRVDRHRRRASRALIAPPGLPEGACVLHETRNGNLCLKKTISSLARSAPPARSGRRSGPIIDADYLSGKTLFRDALCDRFDVSLARSRGAL